MPDRATVDVIDRPGPEAFKPGGHVDAVRRDRARGRHKTDYFLRLRPLLERGTPADATPFQAVLA